MRPVKSAAALLMLAALTACTGTGVNSAKVFDPQTGKVQLQVQTSDPSIKSVEFQLNGNVIGTDTDGSDGWGIEYDTTQQPDGIYAVVAYGTTDAGTQVQLLNNSLLIQNGNTSGSSTGSDSGTTGGSTASGTDMNMPGGSMASGTAMDTGSTQFRPVAASRGEWPTSTR